MPRNGKLSRRDFLKITGIALSTLSIKACAPSTMTVLESVLPSATKKPVPGQKTLLPITPEMMLVEAGEFEMGSADGPRDEQPMHTVTISNSFFMSKFEVTFDEYDIFCEDTLRYNLPEDGGLGRGNHPVFGVDWDEAIEYCNWLSKKEGLDPCYSGKGKVAECDFSANGYRLPTEAEWEYAAHGGQKSQGYLFAGSNDPDEVAWYRSNSEGVRHPVGQKKPNELGLFDMSGNNFEWCWDWYVEDYYQESPAIDPRGPSLPQVESPFDLVRSRRSGSCGENSDRIRITTRSFDGPAYPGGNGFRLVRNA